MTLPNDEAYDWLAKHSSLANPTVGHGSQKHQPPHGQAVLFPSPKDTGQAEFLANFASLLVSLVVMIISLCIHIRYLDLLARLSFAVLPPLAALAAPFLANDFALAGRYKTTDCFALKVLAAATLFQSATLATVTL